MNYRIISWEEQTSLIRISQDYLYDKTIEKYMETLRRNPKQITEILVTENFVGNFPYVVLDGHHRLAAAYTSNRKAKIVIIQDPKEIENEHIKRRYNFAQIYVPISSGVELYSITDLLKYGEKK